ncbi:MAG: imidazole glycerol phosphate synthase subunit HisH, partial [Chitinophagaceae bacterium]|nr:imidazole glycerol phosphate synthase subunit HisH [Chitinophagaceae bacterium]
MLKKIGVPALISSKEEDIEKADKLILPGVGAFDACAGKLKQSGLIPLLNKKVLEQKTPVLGICVGMQLLTEGSEEGELPGLGWVKGRIIRFRQNEMPAGFKIPHMGWSDVYTATEIPLFSNMPEQPRFYFVHSYHPKLNNASDELASAEYGYRFSAAIGHDHIAGVQFHPEKSHKFGMQLLSNFVNKY